MADVLNPEQTESTPLNTELETPTLEAATEHAEPSIETTHNPEFPSVESPSAEIAHPVAVASEPTPEHVEEEADLNSMEDFAAVLETETRGQFPACNQENEQSGLKQDHDRTPFNGHMLL